LADRPTNKQTSTLSAIARSGSARRTYRASQFGRKVKARDVQSASPVRGRVARCRPPGRWTLRASWVKRTRPEPAEIRSTGNCFVRRRLGRCAADFRGACAPFRGGQSGHWGRPAMLRPVVPAKARRSAAFLPRPAAGRAAGRLEAPDPQYAVHDSESAPALSSPRWQDPRASRSRAQRAAPAPETAG
jgi:hypothetical protein